MNFQWKKGSVKWRCKHVQSRRFQGNLVNLHNATSSSGSSRGSSCECLGNSVSSGVISTYYEDWQLFEGLAIFGSVFKTRAPENRARRTEAEILKWMNEWKKDISGFKLCTEAENFFRRPVQNYTSTSAFANVSFLIADVGSFFFS